MLASHALLLGVDPLMSRAQSDYAYALGRAGRNKEACAALGEYNKRYAEGASPSLKTRATAAKILRISVGSFS